MIESFKLSILTLTNTATSTLYGMDNFNFFDLSFFNNLIDKVVQYRKELERTQNKLIVSNEKLDQHNIQLEQDVARKTSNLMVCTLLPVLNLSTSIPPKFPF